MVTPDDLVCPDCRARIGTRRRRCPTCNVWAQRVKRSVSTAMAHRHPEDYRELTEKVRRLEWNRLILEYAAAVAHTAGGGDDSE